MPTHYLAIDLGAESGRVMLGTLDGGRLGLEELHRFPNTPVTAGGALTWDLPRLLGEVKAGLRLAAASPLPIAGISTDSWGVDYALFDSAGALMSPTFHYRDARTARGVEHTMARIDWATIFEETGIQFMPLNTIFQLAAETPERLASAVQMLTIADAFNFMLCGVARMDESNASTTQLYNPRARQWSKKLVHALGLPARMFPPIVPCGTKLGVLQPGVMRDTGLPAVDVIASCSHDTGAAVAAVPVDSETATPDAGPGPPTWAYLSSGTWSLMGVELPSPVISAACRELNFTNEIGHGSSVRLLKNIIGLWLVQECRREWAGAGQEFDYPVLARLAAGAPAFASLLNPADPRFVGPGEMPRKIAAFCRETGQPEPSTPGATIRCALESLALLYRRTLRQLELLLGTRFAHLHIVGGGSRNGLLNQFTANALQNPGPRRPRGSDRARERGRASPGARAPAFPRCCAPNHPRQLRGDDLPPAGCRGVGSAGRAVRANHGSKSTVAQASFVQMNTNCPGLRWFKPFSSRENYGKPKRGAKRLECDRLAGAVVRCERVESGSKLRALQTLRELLALRPRRAGFVPGTMASSRFGQLFNRFFIGALFAFAAGAIAVSADVRTIIVTNDLALEKGATLDARLIVRASHVTIEGNGATLQGPGGADNLKALGDAGVGIRIEGCVNVTIRDVKARGFATGLVARDGRALLVEGCDFSDNYHNPKHGWGELPPRGGLLLERVDHSVVRNTRANRVWDGVHLVESDENLIEENDFSHCSNTCAKLWRASRNRFLRNNLSYGIRIDRAAGEVHARDSTSVLIESGSDDNYWFRNDITQGGDGIFIRVLNGWVSRGNVFVENDTSYANNNCVESWSPGNTYLRNKANHGSYGFWLGGSDQTVLIGNEAAFNGQTNGNHNAPESGFGHGGIVIVGGPSSHTVISGNWCHHNNGGGIVFRGDAASKGARWRTHHWIVQQNRLEENRWGIWGRWGDGLWLAQNTSTHNAQSNFLADVMNLQEPANDPGVTRPPRAELLGPARAIVGAPVRFDASASRDPNGRPLHFRWSAGDLASDQAVLDHTFTTPGFYRLGLTVDNGVLADMAWRDLIVSEPVKEEIGTEGQAAQWGFELEGNADGRGRMNFTEDASAVAGKTSLRFTPDPYPGQYATAIFPRSRDADWDFSGRTTIRFWIRATNPNLPGFQNPGPVLWLYGKDGTVKLEPAKGRNLFGDLPFSEARWTWMPVQVPLAGSADWSRKDSGKIDLTHVTGLGIALDSWGGDPFTIWLDGLTAE